VSARCVLCSDIVLISTIYNITYHIYMYLESEAESMFLDLFFDTSIDVGKSLSKRERDRKQLTKDKSLIYGEVEFGAFYDILRTISAAPGSKFYDLGSGTGKVSKHPYVDLHIYIYVCMYSCVSCMCDMNVYAYMRG
jgi:Histone methylation protein DOT1